MQDNTDDDDPIRIVMIGEPKTQPNFCDLLDLHDDEEAETVDDDLFDS